MSYETNQPRMSSARSVLFHQSSSFTFHFFRNVFKIPALAFQQRSTVVLFFYRELFEKDQSRL